MITTRTSLVALGLTLGACIMTSTALAQDLPRPKTPAAKAPTKAPAKAAPKPVQAPKAPAAEAAPEPETDGQPAEAVEPAPTEAEVQAQEAVEDPADEAVEVEVEPAEEAGEGEPPAAPEMAAPAAEPTAPTTPVFSYYPSAQTDERPAILPYHEGDAVPDGYHLGSRMRRGLVIGGGITFGLTYLAAVGVAVQVHNDEAEPVDDFFAKKSDANALFVPVVGPFVAAGHLAEERGGAAAVAVFDGLAQAAGLSMFIAGLAAPKTVLVKNEEQHVSVIPGAVGSPSGLTVVGAF
jgi:hypothetical protein